MPQDNADSITTRFKETIKESFQDNLSSVILYGSLASGGYIPGVSDINILILLYKSNPRQIFSFGGKAASMIRKGKITPQILTKDEFLRSADIFPLEYIDLKSNSKVLFGEDVLILLKLEKSNLRHQVESLLRGNIATLRQILTAAGGKEKELTSALKAWGGSQRTLFKGLLRLKGAEIAGISEEQMIREVGSLYHIDTAGFTALGELRHGGKTSSLDTAEKTVSALINLADTVDSMEDAK